MKELLQEIWKELTPALKRNILPLIIGCAFIGITYVFLKFTESNSVEIQSILKIRSFQIVLLIVSVILTIIYFRKFLEIVKPKKIFGLIFLILIVCGEIYTFYKLFQPPKTLFYISIYQFDSQNYDSNKLKMCITELNDNYPSFNFIIHNEEKFSEDHETEINAESAFNYMTKYNDENNSIVIALTSKTLTYNFVTNLFSVSAKNKCIISTSDWNSERFQPISVYKYIFSHVAQCALISYSKKFVNPLNLHAKDIATGCIFDYKFEKVEIINAIIHPKICKSHKDFIKENFGRQPLDDFEKIITFEWWPKIVDYIE
jgi:hypothetical protein